MVDVDDAPLTKRMAAASRQQHSASNALVLAKLAVILTSRELYAQAITDFWHIHKSLEGALVEQQTRSTEVAELAALLPVVGRSAGFAEDVAYLTGRLPEAQGPLRPSVAAYVSHLHAVAKEEPRLLLAHAFTQHLALLAGGQVVSRTVRKQLALPADQGTAAYHFSSNPREVAQQYKDTVDAFAPRLEEEGVQKVLAEHVRVFELNNEVLRSFPTGYWPAARALVRYMVTDAGLALSEGM